MSAAAAALAAVGFTSAQPPSALAPTAIAGTSELRTEEFRDERALEFAVETRAADPIHVTVAGTVTQNACRPGAMITSGGSLGSVDGATVVALHTTTPLWRPLTASTTGADMTALRAEVARLRGETSPVSARTAVNHLARLLQLPVTTTTVPVDHVAWIPAASVRAGACPAPLSAQLASGAALVTLPPDITRLAARTLPSDAMAGARVVRIGSTTLPVGADGSVTDRAALGNAALNPQVIAAASPDAKNPLMGQWLLKDAVTVSRAPASAVISDGAAMCVVAEGGAKQAVTVTSSALGMAALQFTGAPPQRIVSSPPEGTRCS